MTYRIHVRNLIETPAPVLWNNLFGDFYVVFDDCEVLTNERQVLYSHYGWRILKDFPDQPIVSDYLVTSVMSDGDAPADCHLRLFGKIYWATVENYRHRYPDVRKLINRLNEQTYYATNLLYNDTVERCLPWVGSLDIEDFIDVIEHPEMEAVFADDDYSYEGVAKINETVVKLLRKDPGLKYNPLSIAVRTGISRIGQTTQILGAIGYIKDVNSRVFPHPIRSNYLKGVVNFYESLIESRLASEALYNTRDPVQQSDYFSRRQQLINMRVRTVHMCDCGSKSYIHWMVRDERCDEHGEKRASDLETLVGKYYLDEETGKLKVVRKSDTHLFGKTIKLRSPYGKCLHPDPSGVCAVCVGEAALAVPEGSNVGHAFTTSFMQRIIQLILSTKHYTGSAKVENIRLSPTDARYFSTKKDEGCYYLNHKLKRFDKVYLKFAAKEAPGITQLNLVDDVSRLSVTRTSEFTTVRVLCIKGELTEEASAEVKVGGRNASLTHEALRQIKKTGADLRSDGNYWVDLTGWNYDDALMELPNAHFSMTDHMTEIKASLELTKKSTSRRGVKISLDASLSDFHDLVNRRLSVNLAILELALLGSLGIDPENGDFGIPKANTSYDVSAMRDILACGSLSAALAFEHHRALLMNPRTYMRSKRTGHPFDAIILPQILHNKSAQKHIRSRAESSEIFSAMRTRQEEQQTYGTW